MTAQEIENSGIYNASKFSITLNNGSIIILSEDLPTQRYFVFNRHENTLQAYTYFDTKGRHNKHITIAGKDIFRIQIQTTKEEGDKIHNNWQVFSYLALAIVVLFCLYQSCH